MESIYKPLQRLSVILLGSALVLMPANAFASRIKASANLLPQNEMPIKTAVTQSTEGAHPSEKKENVKDTKAKDGKEDKKDAQANKKDTHAKNKKSAKETKKNETKNSNKAKSSNTAENAKKTTQKSTQSKQSTKETTVRSSNTDSEPSEPAWPSFWAKHRIMDYYAHDDGSINEWAPGYYVAHSTSSAGQAIHESGVGSVIIIDGTPVTIDSRQYRSVDDDYEGIRESLGADCVIFQTCDGGGMNLILTGHADGWGPFATVGGGIPTGRGEEVIEEHVTYVNDYGEFSTYEEAEAARIAAEESQVVIEAQPMAMGLISTQSEDIESEETSGMASFVIEGTLE